MARALGTKASARQPPARSLLPCLLLRWALSRQERQPGLALLRAQRPDLQLLARAPGPVPRGCR